MLLGKLCERKDKTALMYMHSTLQTRKLIYKTTRIILPRQLTPIYPFICGKPIAFATFSRTVVITPVNNTKHQFPFHRKFMKHRVKRILYLLTGLMSPQCGTVCHQPRVTRVCRWALSNRLKTDNNEHRPASRGCGASAIFIAKWCKCQFIYLSVHCKVPL